jgi:putative serine protease PepD
MGGRRCILTNNHVISIAAHGTVEVLFSDGQTEPATITGRDVLTDLAVLHVQPSHQLKVIDLGSSASVKVGQPVVALGAPLGLSGAVTSGIISALDRTVEVPAENDKSALLVSALQTDAAINPGNSGGALVNCAGQLIGVPTAGATVPGSAGGSIGLGFAIPVDLATTIADELIATGTVTHAFFGLATVPIPPAAAAQAGVPEGLYVQAVTPGGPAAMAGLRAEDVITHHRRPVGHQALVRQASRCSANVQAKWAISAPMAAVNHGGSKMDRRGHDASTSVIAGNTR